MSAAFFSPNKNETGGCLFVSFNSKEGSVFLKLLRQDGYSKNKKDQKFDGKNPFNFKLSVDEVGDVIRTVRQNSNLSFYHKFEDDTSTVTFRHYLIKAESKEEKDKEGFVLHFKRGDVEIKIGFSLGSAERLAQYLEFALRRIFEAEYAEDKKQREEWQEKNGSKKKSSGKKKSRKDEPEESDDNDSDEEDSGSEETDSDSSDENESSDEEVDF